MKIMRGALTALGLGLALVAPAAAQNHPPLVTSPQGLAVFNADVQATYDRLRPALEVELRRQAEAQLGALKHDEGRWSVKVDQIRAIRLEIQRAPGFRALTTEMVKVALPAQGTWRIEVEVDISAHYDAKWRWLRKTLHFRKVRIILEDVKAIAAAHFDTTDPLRPLVSRVDRPELSFKIKLRSTRLLTGLIVRAATPFANKFARKALADALDTLTPQLAALQGLPGDMPGAGSALLTDSGTATPFQELVDNVEAKMEAVHLPHGMIVMVETDAPSSASWLDDYKNGGAGLSGNVTNPHGDFGDSAIWTGHYLSAQAFRYRETGSAQALANVKHVLSGLRAALEIYGNTGLLARVVAPENSPEGVNIAQQPRAVRRFMRGEWWVGHSGKGISRDQYMGAIMGLWLTYDLVGDLAVRQESSALLQRMFDYIRSTGWFIEEDRPAFSAQAGSFFPTFWTGIPTQRLNYLVMANTLDPQKYGAELAHWSPIAETAWIAAWTGTFNLQSYYGHNLAHGTYYNYFRVENDPHRWQHVARAFHIERRYTELHKNAHFNLIHASVDPSLAATLHPAVREAVRQFVDTPHRDVTAPVIDLSNVTWVTLTLPTVTVPGKTPVPATQTLPSAALDLTQRSSEGHFIWQRSPFHPGVPNRGHAKVEKPGIDLTLPFWMGRHHGAF